MERAWQRRAPCPPPPAPHPAAAALAAYLPTIPLTALGGWLGLAPGAQLKRFLREKRAVLAAGGAGLDVKACRGRLLELQAAAAGDGG